MSMQTLIPRRWRTDEDLGFVSLQRAMNELFGDFVPTLELPAVAGSALRNAWMPRLDFVESEKDFQVMIELPGLDQKNIDVSLVGDLLTIKGEKKMEYKSEQENNGQTWHRTERTWGAFQRTVQLPCDVDHKALKAFFHNGVLRVTLPKALPAQRPVSKIEIKAI
jgi:HSP20 family protein